MRVTIVFESSYGNTRQIAEAIADGMRAVHDVRVVPVGTATRELVADADLVVVGGPTHAHGMSRPDSRAAAVAAAGRSSGALTLDSVAGEIGVPRMAGHGARRARLGCRIRHPPRSCPVDDRPGVQGYRTLVATHRLPPDHRAGELSGDQDNRAGAGSAVRRTSVGRVTFARTDNTCRRRPLTAGAAANTSG